MKQSGFTIIEIVVTITVMGILLTLAVVNMSSSQVRARDDERKSDVESIARHLETYYRNGTGQPGDTIGRYPPTAFASDTGSVSEYLVDIDPRSLTAPNADNGSRDMSLIAATNSTQTTNGVSPTPNVDRYVYQPLRWSGSAWALCTGTQECRRFNIFYKLESDGTVYRMESRNK